MTLGTGTIAFRTLPIFRNTSVRLLADLVDRVSDDERIVPAQGPITDSASIVVVLDGHVRVIPAAASRKARLAMVDMQSAPPGSGIRFLSAGEAYVADERNFTSREVTLIAARGKDARVLLVTEPKLKGAINASFSLAWSLDRTMARMLLGAGSNVPLPKLHCIWVCGDASVTVPPIGLARLLASAIATQFREGTALAVFGSTDLALLAVWQHGRFVPVRTDRTLRDRESLLQRLRDVEERPFHHVLFVSSSPMDDIPARWSALQFDRVVYLTSTLPSGVPPWVRRRLVPGLVSSVDPSSPYFSSVIPTIVSPRPADLRASIPGVVRLLGKVARRRRATVVSTPVADEAEAGAPAASGTTVEHGRRLRRDLCRVFLEKHSLAQIEKVSARFPFSPVALSEPDEEALGRWARAVTNRQVGLALSGGGGSSYRLVRFVKHLQRRGVPIDVVSGNSGGTLFGAYYCKDGVPGLRRTLDRGIAFQLCFVFSVLRSECIEWLLDVDLGAARLEQLDVRLVPLTTALRDGEPPRAHVLVAGTLGEAVRASGAAPGLVGPMDAGRTRYTDGAASNPLPARVLKDFGADLVFACNSIPGPDRRNPLDHFPFGIGKFLYRRTPVGRAMDMWVSGAYALQQASREAARDAHQFVEAAPQAAPLLEIFCFLRGRQIAADWTRADLDESVNQCVDRWLAFARPRG